jgi:hypothetical protein
VGDDSAFNLADFDRYVEEHGIPEEDYPAAFALWIAEKTGGPVPKFEKVEEPETSRTGARRGARSRLQHGTDAFRAPAGFSLRRESAAG